MSAIDLQPIGTVAQMKTAQAVVRSCDVLYGREDTHTVAYDLLFALDTMNFQSDLDHHLDTLREEFSAASLDAQKRVLDIIPNLNQKV